MKSLMAVLATLAIAGCGDDVTTNHDASVDLSAASDFATGDATSNADGQMAADGGACTNGGPCMAGGRAGLCANNVCGACTDTTDDAACTAAYGSPYLCIGGACVPGNCRDDSNCATGQICGLDEPNLCAGCTSDQQCQNDATYGAAFVCNTTSNTCVSSACTSADNTACTSNPGDVCCTSVCVAGSCCTTAFCVSTKGNGFSCVNHVCSQCDGVTNKTYLVDPVNGDDSAGTGSGTSGGATAPACAFKTITRALQVIGATPPSNTTITVIGPSTVQAGEAFPIAIPANVTLNSKTGAVTIKPPANTVGVVMATTPSAITGFTIDGSTNTATSGIQCRAGATASTNISHVTVQNMANDGIGVTGGTCTIGPGVKSTGNGTANSAAARHSGLHVAGGTAIVNVPSGSDVTSFDHNTEYGIKVEGGGTITLTGAPGTGGAGTVVITVNALGGVDVAQTPGGTAAAASFDGAVVWANTGAGMRLFAGSAVKVRNSYILANGAQGILVATGAGQSNDVSKIDLGTSADFGKNTVQAGLGNNPNSGVGICLQIQIGQGQTLRAEGNQYSSLDCSQTNPGALSVDNTCAGKSDIGINDQGTIGLGGKNDIDVANCTHP